MNSMPANKSPVNKSIAIIGPGNVGTTLAILAARNGYQVCIGARNSEQANIIAEKVGHGCKGGNIPHIIKKADFVLLTVSDDAIQSVCEELSAQSAFAENAVVVHCSGALDSDVLNSAIKTANCATASMHPLQSFPDAESALNSMNNVCCYYEGDSAALEKVKDFINDIGLMPVLIEKHAKTLYHIVGVTACNYLSALMDAALESGELANIDRDTMWQSLFPLVSSTLGNINRNGPSAALTGPIERGDIETIKRHVNSLLEIDKNLSTIPAIYATMGKQTIKLALKKQSISEDTAKKLLVELEKLD